MQLKKRYSFLYLPDGQGPSRTIRLPVWSVHLAAMAVAGLLLVAGLYIVDWSLGTAWRPGGSPLAVQNDLLRRDAARFESRLASIQGDLDAVFAYQQMVAAAVDLQPLDAQVRAGGVGGRGPLQAMRELPDQPAQPAIADLESLLRQARIQRQGLAAMIDSLAARQDSRDRLPSIRPCDTGWISSRFGMRTDPFTNKQAFHRGLDFSVPVGTPVRATADGVIASVEKQRGLGRMIKIDHGGGVMTIYGHLQTVQAARGQKVLRGEVIALSGSSGRSTAPHLHYEIRIGGHAVNPLTYILDSYAELR